MYVYAIYSRAQEFLGKSSQKIIFQRLTEAIQLLAYKGDWQPLIGLVDIKGANTDYRAFALPNDVETPLAINICGRPTYMRNQWAEFHLNGLGSNSETPWTWDDQGPQPTVQDIIRPASLLALADLKNDLFTKLHVYGYDELNRWIRTQNPDGSWQDGLIIQPNLITDFPNQTVIENTYRLFYRYFNVIPVTTLISSTPHGFQTGVATIITTTAGSTPTPLVNGQTYFLSVVDDYTVQLYALLSDASAGTNVIQLDNVSAATVLDLEDQRQIQTQTKFTSTTDLNFLEAAAVTFTGTTLPTPILANETFYLNLIDNRNFTIHATASDAENAVNPLFVTTPGSNDLKANAQQPATPYTKLVFSVPHRFLQNDVVTASNASGNLPNPLIPATNYYVRYLTATEITLHTTLSDAASGNNPIVLTDNGTGVSALVKLIPATANVGSVNNINAPNSNLQIGDFVQFSSTGNLPTPLQSGQVYVVTSPNGGTSFTIATPPAIPIATTARYRANNVAIIVTNGPHNLVTGNLVNITGVGGVGYNLAQVAVTVLASNVFSYASTGADETPVSTATRSRSNEIAAISTGTPHGFSTGDYINIQNLGGSSYNLPWVKVTVLDANNFWYNDIGVNDVGFSTSARSRTANVARVTTIVAHGLSTGQFINIQGFTDSSFNDPNAQVTVVNATVFTYANNGPNRANVADTRGYAAIPQADTNGLVGKPSADTGGTVSGNLINITDVGSGVLDAVISRAFTIGFYDNWFLDASNLATGSAFTVNSTGSLPATIPQITPTATYYARKIDAFTAQFFTTLAKANDSTVRATASYARTSNVATLVTQTAHGFTTGDVVEVSFMDDASFNTPTHPSNAGATITVVDAVTFTYASTGSDASTTADTAGQVIFSPINIYAIGSGTTDIVLSRLVSATVFSNLLEVSSASFILPNTLYQFTTNGTLPAPLVTGTNYEINVINGLIQVSDTSGNIIILTSIGSGTHFITRDVLFHIGIPQGVRCLANEYNDGDLVIVNQPGSVNQGSAPAPLVQGGTYYLRRIDDETVQIYDTQAHAQDLTSTVGIQVPTTTGIGQSSFFQILPPFKVQHVQRVRLEDGQSPAQAALPDATLLGNQPPPLRNGFIDLYAWDYGRQPNLTLLGHYGPQDREPIYRRIKVACNSQWIRMRYRRKTFEITSMEDYIPLSSEMAVLYMVRAQELYRTNFFDEAQKYEALAVGYLLDENQATQGPESIAIQINDDVFTNSKAAWMT